MIGVLTSAFVRECKTVVSGSFVGALSAGEWYIQEVTAVRSQKRSGPCRSNTAVRHERSGALVEYAPRSCAVLPCALLHCCGILRKCVTLGASPNLSSKHAVALLCGTIRLSTRLCKYQVLILSFLSCQLCLLGCSRPVALPGTSRNNFRGKAVRFEGGGWLHDQWPQLARKAARGEEVWRVRHCTMAEAVRGFSVRYV